MTTLRLVTHTAPTEPVLDRTRELVEAALRPLLAEGLLAIVKDEEQVIWAYIPDAPPFRPPSENLSLAALLRSAHDFGAPGAAQIDATLIDAGSGIFVESTHVHTMRFRPAPTA